MYLLISKNKTIKYIIRLTLLIVVLILTIFWANFVNAENINQKILDLRKQIEELTKQAEQYKNTITKTQKEANTLKKQIDTINAQIGNLTTQISITEKQIDKTGLEIDDTNKTISATTRSIVEKQSTISQLIKYIRYKDQETLLATLLKSNTLSDFMDELRYSENLSGKIGGLLLDLKKEKEVLETEKIGLESKKNELENLNKKRFNQKSSLGGTKQSKDTLLTQTRGQEIRYQALLSEAERKKEEFFDELRSLEGDALQSGAFIVHVTADSVPPPGTKLFMYPYDDYVLTQSYGLTAYAKKGVYGGVPHNGIDIASGMGSAIKPIGSGKILTSGTNAGWGNWVAVRHENNMVSVYAHMRSSTSLAPGTSVTTSDIIGYEGSTGNSTGSHLHLSLYKDFFTFINPKNGQVYFNYFDGSLNPLDYLG